MHTCTQEHDQYRNEDISIDILVVQLSPGHLTIQGLVVHYTIATNSHFDNATPLVSVITPSFSSCVCVKRCNTLGFRNK